MKKIYLMLIFCLSFIFSGSIFANNAQVDDYGVKMIKVDDSDDTTTDDKTMDDNTKPDDKSMDDTDDDDDDSDMKTDEDTSES